MESASSSAQADAAGFVDVEGRPHGLAANTLGLPGVLFCIVTGSAPMAAMLFNVPYAVGYGGYGGPAAYLVATVILTIFSVGYIEMARRVSSAGGFYSFVSHGFGQVMGMGTAVTITLCYMIFSASVIGVTAYFANGLFNSWFGWNIGVLWLILAMIAIMAVLSWFHIEFTSKILGVFLVTEVLALVVFGFAVLFQGGAHGIPLGVLNPTHISNNPGAKLAGHAFPGVVFAAGGIAFFGAFWSWVGFEMAPNYAEESKQPKKLMASATYISVIGLGILYTFICWMFVAGWGKLAAASSIGAQFTGKLPHGYASAFFPLTDRYVGHFWTNIFELTIVTGSFACQLAFFNTSARYLFSMGREGIIPRVFGRTHPTHKSPYIACMTVIAFLLVYDLAFYAKDSSTAGALLKLGTWGPLMGVTGILVIQALTCAAIIWYFWSQARDGFHWWKTLIAPILGGAGCLFVAYLLVHNDAFLSAGAGNSAFIKYLQYWLILMFVIGVVLALYYRSADRARYDAIGRYLHEDVPSSEPVAQAGLSPAS